MHKAPGKLGFKSINRQLFVRIPLSFQRHIAIAVTSSPTGMSLYRVHHAIRDAQLHALRLRLMLCWASYEKGTHHVVQELEEIRNKIAKNKIAK